MAAFLKLTFFFYFIPGTAFGFVGFHLSVYKFNTHLPNTFIFPFLLKVDWPRPKAPFNETLF